MLSFPELLFQIGDLKDQGVSYGEIGKSLDPPLSISRVNFFYLSYIRPFSESFHDIINVLKRNHLVKYEEECRTVLYLVLSHIFKKRKFRNAKILTPIVSYLVFKVKGETMDACEFCRDANISFSNFKKGLRIIIPIYLEHGNYNRDERVLDMIERIRFEFCLDPISEFYIESLKALHLSRMENSLDEFIAFYHSIRKKMQGLTKYKTLKISGPIILYMFLKTKGILISLPKFLEAHQLSYRQFTLDLKVMITRHHPEYITRDKRSITKGYVISILNSFFRSNDELLSNAISLQDHFYFLLQHSKEEVYAAVICVLTMVACELPEISMAAICERAGVSQSTLSMHFLGRIFPHLGIPDTITLKNAFPVIRRKIQAKIPLKEVIGKKKLLISPTIHPKTSPRSSSKSTSKRSPKPSPRGSPKIPRKRAPKISPTININLIFDYLEELLNKIAKSAMPEIKPALLDEIMYYASDIKINIREIVKALKEKEAYKKEELILSAAIYLSCPFINAIIAGKILFQAIHKKTSYESISRLLRQVSFQKTHVRHLFLPFRHAGRVLERGRTDIQCATCGNFVYLLRYADDVILTTCKQCLQKRAIES